MNDSDTENREVQTTKRALLKAVGAGTALAVAPRSGAASSSAPEATTSSTTTSDDGEQKDEDGPESVRASIVDGVTLVSYEVLEESSDGVTFEVVVESNYPTQLVMSDVFGGVDGGGGVTQVEQSRRTITSGRTTATMTASTYEEASALGVGVPGGAVTIPHEVQEAAQKVTLPFGITLGAGIFGVGTVYAAKKKRDGYRDEPEDVDPNDGGLLSW